MRFQAFDKNMTAFLQICFAAFPDIPQHPGNATVIPIVAVRAPRQMSCATSFGVTVDEKCDSGRSGAKADGDMRKLMPRGLKLRALKSKDFEWIPALSNAGFQDIENSFSVSIPAINLSNILYSLYSSG